MEWSRTCNSYEFVSWLFLCSLLWFGSWWLVKFVFNIRHREQLFAGFALRMSLFIVFSNILAQRLPLVQSFWIPAIVLCIAGLAAVISHRSQPHLSSKDANANIGLALAYISLLFVFARINLGLAISDDKNNLPLVSRLAAGDFPPHFYLNPTQRLDYHYGLHLFTASQGYWYYCVDNETWFNLPATIQVAFTDHCVKIIDHIDSQDIGFLL